jgi:hypothetical protein
MSCAGQRPAARTAGAGAGQLEAAGAVHLWWEFRWSRRFFGRDWSPVSSVHKQSPWLLLSNIVSTTQPQCSPHVQPGGGIFVYAGESRADPRRSGVGLVPGPQAPPMPDRCQLPLWFYICGKWARYRAAHHCASSRALCQGNYHLVALARPSGRVAALARPDVELN